MPVWVLACGEPVDQSSRSKNTVEYFSCFILQLCHELVLKSLRAALILRLSSHGGWFIAPPLIQLFFFTSLFITPIHKQSNSTHTVPVCHAVFWHFISCCCHCPTFPWLELISDGNYLTQLHIRSLLHWPSSSSDCKLWMMFFTFSHSQAFFQGKLKIKGNMGLAMKLQSLQLQPGKAKL